MDFAYSPKVQELRERVTAFMDAYVYPAEPVFERQVSEGDRWQPTAIMEELKAKAKAEGLWNLFLPESELGAGLSNLEYAPLAEIMGRSLLGPEPFNCSAPDTGNMEVLVRYANEEQKQRWLEPLLRGEIRSAFAMTEPGVASSDATNMEARAVREGDEWVINGSKWWTSGACDPRCKIMIFMGLTNPDAPAVCRMRCDSPSVCTSVPMPVQPCRSNACSGGCGLDQGGPGRSRNHDPRPAIRFHTAHAHYRTALRHGREAHRRSRIPAAAAGFSRLGYRPAPGSSSAAGDAAHPGCSGP